MNISPYLGTDYYNNQLKEGLEYKMSLTNLFTYSNYIIWYFLEQYFPKHVLKDAAYENGLWLNLGNAWLNTFNQVYFMQNFSEPLIH